MSHLVPLLEFNQVQFFHEFKPVERPPVYELSAVNCNSLRFKCSATAGWADGQLLALAGAPRHTSATLAHKGLSDEIDQNRHEPMSPT
jgi:hypothetical protein